MTTKGYIIVRDGFSWQNWSEYYVPLGIVERLGETIRKARGEI